MRGDWCDAPAAAARGGCIRDEMNYDSDHDTLAFFPAPYL